MNDCLRPTSSPLPQYEPRYYERAAQRHVARQSGAPCFVNVPWGTTGNPATRPELDALLRREGRFVPIEVKAYRLGGGDTAAILPKYRDLGFSHLILVAPGAEARAARDLAASKHPTVELLAFQPELSQLWDWYERDWPAFVPPWTHEALTTGHHHIRFVLAQATDKHRFVIGQQRSRVYDTATVTKLLSRLPSPPVRVLWTPQQFTIPRDVIARRSRLTPLGGFVAVDIDGDRLHRAQHACQLSPVELTCLFCERYAKREVQRLTTALPAHARVDVLASGGRGLHVYYRDDGYVREDVLHLARKRIVRLEESVTAATRSTLALPGSLHAGAMRPVISVISGVSRPGKDNRTERCW